MTAPTNQMVHAHVKQPVQTNEAFDMRLFDELLGRFVHAVSARVSEVCFDPVKAQECSYAELVTIVTSCPDPLIAYQYGMAALEGVPDEDSAARMRLWTARHALRLWDVNAATTLLAQIPCDQSSYASEQNYLQRLDMEIVVAEALCDFATAAQRKEAKARLKLQYNTPGVQTPNPQAGRFSRFAGFLLSAARDYILAGEYERARALYNEVLSADPTDPGYGNVAIHQRAAEEDVRFFDELVRLRGAKIARAQRSFATLRGLYEQHGAAWLAELERAARQRMNSWPGRWRSHVPGVPRTGAEPTRRVCIWNVIVRGRPHMWMP
ncbi:MAG: hypothetical protein N2595_07585 [bacterium]|nr:hypothetical protein [bacterium]